MADEIRPNDPGGRRPREKVQQLQRRLWVAAKRAPERRFHALYDHIGRGDVLLEAWKRVRRNKGAAGVDGHSIRDVEQYGVERFLEELGAALRAGTYRPCVVRRRYIPKADGKKRPLGIPTVRDRVIQETTPTCHRLCGAVPGGAPPYCQEGEGVCVHYTRDPEGVGECVKP